MRASALLVFIVSFALSGCFTGMTQRGREGISSSLVDYLYPQGERPPEFGDVLPTLNVPLRVGLGFVPSARGAGLPEATQVELLGKVKQSFEHHKFIQEIVVIPDSYLRVGNGFENLGQISRLYGVEVVALVSYDQVANVTDTKASLFYWTIVGAYLIKGSENAVQTFVDTAVFDIPSRKLLFRAPGISRIESSSTLVDADAELRKNRAAGFDAAFDDMNKNLEASLQKFRERIKTEKVATVNYSRNSGGGGSAGLLWLAVLAVLAIARYRRS